MKYFYDQADNELPERTFWSVLSTLRSDGWKIILEEARYKQSDDNNEEFIEIHPYLLNKIFAVPMLPKDTFI